MDSSSEQVRLNNDLLKNTPAKRNIKPALTYGFRIVISVLLLYYIFQKIDYDKLINVISEANTTLLLVVLLFAYLLPLCNAWLLRNVLKAFQVKAGMAWLFRITLITNFYSLFLPGATSAVVKWYKLSKRTKGIDAFNSVVFVRILEMAVVCVNAAIFYIFFGHIRIPGLMAVLIISALLSTGVLFCAVSHTMVNFVYILFKKYLFKFLPMFLEVEINKIIKSLFVLASLPLSKVLNLLS